MSYKVVTTQSQQMAYIPILDENTINLIADKVAERLAKMFSPEQEPRYYSRKEVAQLLHVSIATIANMTARGMLAPKRFGRRVLFDADAIDKAIKDKSIYKLKKKRC